MKKKGILILFIAAVLAAVFVISFSKSHRGPEGTFSQLIGCKMPPSVSWIENSDRSSMDAGFVVLHFHINPDDMAKVIQDAHFSKMKPEEMEKWDNTSRALETISKTNYLQMWEKRINRNCPKAPVALSDYDVYAGPSKSPAKYFFINPGRTDAIFVYDSY